MGKSYDDIDMMYGLLMESHLDLMYLPSGAVAWLFDRPEEQVQAAAKLGVEAKRNECEIVDSSLLRADRNVLVLKTQTGTSIRVYPGGWYGVGDESFAEVEGLIQFFEQSSPVQPAVDDLPDPHPGEGMDGEPDGKLRTMPNDLGGDMDDVGMDDMAFDLPGGGGMTYNDLLVDDEGHQNDLDECEDDDGCECKKIREDDGGESFTFGQNTWDVAKAWKLIKSGKVQGEVKTVPIKDYAEKMLALDRDKDWSEQDQGMWVHLDHEHSQSIPSNRGNEPGLIVQTDTGALIIDGNHRVAKTYMNGGDEMKFFVVEKGEDQKFRAR